jgi:hypothetical protein
MECLVLCLKDKTQLLSYFYIYARKNIITSTNILVEAFEYLQQSDVVMH